MILGNHRTEFLEKFLNGNKFEASSCESLVFSDISEIVEGMPSLSALKRRDDPEMWSGCLGNLRLSFYPFDGDSSLYTVVFENYREGYIPPVPSLCANELMVFEDSCFDVIGEAKRRGILAGYFDGYNPVFDIGNGYFLEVACVCGYTGVPIPPDPINGKYFFETAWIRTQSEIDSGVRGELRPTHSLPWDPYPPVDPTETWIGPETYKRSW